MASSISIAFVEAWNVEQFLSVVLNEKTNKKKWQYDFDGRKDLVKFVKTVAAAGLYVHLRIGPYVCAEWNYG